VRMQSDLRRRLRKAGCAEINFAGFVPVSHPVLSRWLNRQIQFRPERLRQIAVALRFVEATAAGSRLPVDFRDKRLLVLAREHRRKAHAEAEKSTHAHEDVEAERAS